MKHRPNKPALHRALALLATVAALAAVACWYATRGANAWALTASRAPEWPRYAGVHQGRIILLSSLWDGGLSSTGWIYDAKGTGNLGHAVPRYTNEGDTYGGTPPFNSLLYAASVPIWYAAIPFAMLALHQFRCARWASRIAHNFCPRCAYSKDGLSTTNCPECGRAWDHSGKNSTVRPAARADAEV